MRIGLISDTHGLLRPQAIEALRGSDLILHAGDVGKPEILETLRELAPVTAVRGNIDNAEWARSLPITAAVEAAGWKIWMLHNVHDLDLDPAASGFHFVVSGHSHQPSKKASGGVHYLNPGSAGPRRFRLPLTIAHLDLQFSQWEMRLVDVSG